jgi:hypothetical protein
MVATSPMVKSRQPAQIPIARYRNVQNIERNVSCCLAPIGGTTAMVVTMKAAITRKHNHQRQLCSAWRPFE